MFSMAGAEQMSWEGTRIYCYPMGSHVGFKITKVELVELGSQVGRLR